MAAAVALADLGVRVTVYESARVLGGRARRVIRDGITLDNGQHILVGAYRETLCLLERVGMSGTSMLRHPLHWTFPPRFAFRVASRLPAPWHVAAGLLNARGLSIAARVRCVRFFDWCKRRAFRLDADTTLASLLQAHKQPPDVIRFLWQPLCMAALNTPPDHASAQIFLNVLRDGLAADRSASDLILPRIDLTTLFPEAAARYIEQRQGIVRLGTPVIGLDRHAERYAITTRSGRTEHAAVIVAVQPSHVAALLNHFDPLSEALRQINALTHQSIVTVYLRYGGKIELPFPLVGMSGIHGQWLFDRSHINGQRGLVAVVISAHGRENRSSHAELAQRVHEELVQMQPHLGRPEWTQVIEERQATFTCAPNVCRPDQCTALAGLYLAGDYTASDYPATLEAAVRSGLRCAELAAQHLAP